MRKMDGTKLLLFILICAFSIVLAACGNQSGNGENGKNIGQEDDGDSWVDEGDENVSGPVEDHYWEQTSDGKCSLQVQYINERHAKFTVNVETMEKDYPQYDNSIEEGHSIAGIYLSLMDGPMSETTGNCIDITASISNHSGEDSNGRQDFTMAYHSAGIVLQGYRGVRLTLPSPTVTQNGKEVCFDVAIPEECGITFYNFERFQCNFQDEIRKDYAHLSGVKPQEVVVGEVPIYTKSSVDYTGRVGTSLYVKNAKSAVIELCDPFLTDTYNVEGIYSEPRWSIGCYPYFNLDLTWDGWNTVVNQVGLEGMKWELALNDWSEKYGFSPISNENWYDNTIVDESVVTVSHDNNRIVFEINLPEDSSFDFTKLEGQFDVYKQYGKGMGFSLNSTVDQVKTSTAILAAGGRTTNSGSSQGGNQDTALGDNAKVKIDPKRIGIYGADYQYYRFGLSCDENGENVAVSFLNVYDGVIQITQMNPYTGVMTGTGSLTDKDGKQLNQVEVTLQVSETDMRINCLKDGKELITGGGYDSYDYMNYCDYPKTWLGRYVDVGWYTDQPSCDIVLAENEQGFLTVQVTSDVCHDTFTAPAIIYDEYNDGSAYLSNKWKDDENNEYELLMSLTDNNGYSTRTIDASMIVDLENGERTWPLKAVVEQLQTHLPEKGFVNRDKEGIYGGIKTHPEDNEYFIPDTDNFIIKVTTPQDYYVHPEGSTESVKCTCDFYIMESYDPNGGVVTYKRKYAFSDAATAELYYEVETGYEYFSMEDYTYFTLQGNCVYSMGKAGEITDYDRYGIYNSKYQMIPSYYLGDVKFLEWVDPYTEGRKEQYYISKPLTTKECTQIYQDYDLYQALEDRKYEAGDDYVSFSGTDTSFRIDVWVEDVLYTNIGQPIRTDTGWCGVGHTTINDWTWVYAEVLVDENNLNQVTVNWKTYQVSDDMITVENHAEYSQIDSGSFTADLYELDF